MKHQQLLFPNPSILPPESVGAIPADHGLLQAECQLIDPAAVGRKLRQRRQRVQLRCGDVGILLQYHFGRGMTERTVRKFEHGRWPDNLQDFFALLSLYRGVPPILL